MTWLKYLTITYTDCLKENKGSTPYLLEQVISIIDSEKTEILKGNEFIITLSHSIRVEASSKAEGASMPNTSKARRRANMSRKRSNRISLNPVLKEARDNIIL
jgi:hypothetical protein